jgi:hypothetical protein
MNDTERAWREWNRSRTVAYSDDSEVHAVFMYAYRSALVRARGGVLPGPFYDYLTDLIEAVGTKDGDDQ